LRNVFADLHVHIGRAEGRPVKITASRNLTLAAIIQDIAPRKGLDIVGVVDAGTTPVFNELQEMLQQGSLRSTTGEGLPLPMG
jgi:PHP family Zn ribbon phosphoesterase